MIMAVVSKCNYAHEIVNIIKYTWNIVVYYKEISRNCTWDGLQFLSYLLCKFCEIPLNSNFKFGCVKYSIIYYSVLNHALSCFHLYCIKVVENQLKSFFRQPLCGNMMSILIKAEFPLGSLLTDKLFNNTLLAPKVWWDWE